MENSERGVLLELLLELDNPAEKDPVLDWAQVFGNGQPVEIEIGIGKGRYLLAAAGARPETNFVGVEWAAKYLRIALERGRKRRLGGNLRLVRADAREFVEFFVPAASVRAFHVYFPDPWPKKRHHKRRLINPAFLAEVARTLAPGGLLWLATDHEEYFAAMQEALATASRFRDAAAEWGEVKTNYEEKYLRAGKPIYRQVVELAENA
ncbi:MAG: tRNA (guanosine(46)-N7)-methyltransferase TrmB [Candidatus Handelsmanbacteria bacterium]|nr:tRNA (guanosine(46)-N7)-methyltransferase TrmB [Candidatus Handelsmanbacteria bacterium]